MNPAKPMRVVIIDDHTLFREGLSSLLSSRGIEVAACSNAQEGYAQIKHTTPDAVLLDIRMPGMDGLRALRMMRENKVTVPVVMLTTSSDASDLAQCLHNHVSGYLLKDMQPDELVRALRKIVAGEIVVAPELASVLASIVQNNNSSDGLNEHAADQIASQSAMASLTPREIEILCLITDGQSNKMIARKLNISDGTVKLHVKSVLRKLDIHSRVEAAVMAVESGICTRQPDYGSK